MHYEKLHRAGAVGDAEIEKARAALIAAKLRLAQAQAKNSKRQSLDTNPGLKKLLIERRDVLRQRLELATKAFEADEVKLETVVKAASELTDAELELVTEPNQRIALHANRVTRMRQFEMIVQRLQMLQEASKLDVLAATAERLKAEISLAREQAKANAKGKLRTAK